MDQHGRFTDIESADLPSASLWSILNNADLTQSDGIFVCPRYRCDSWEYMKLDRFQHFSWCPFMQLVIRFTLLGYDSDFGWGTLHDGN